MGIVSAAGTVTVMDMIRKLLTLTAIAAASFAVAPTSGVSASGTYTCPEFGVTSVSTGTVVNKKLVFAAFCFTGGVDKTGTLRVSGETVDAAKNDGLCTVAKVAYTSNNRTSEIVVPMNCGGGRVAVAGTTIRNVSTANISMCMFNQATGKTSVCTGKNTFHPAPKPVVGGGIVRR